MAIVKSDNELKEKVEKWQKEKNKLHKIKNKSINQIEYDLAQIEKSLSYVAYNYFSQKKDELNQDINIINANIESLNSEMSKMGFFSFSQKNNLKHQIVSKQKELEDKKILVNKIYKLYKKSIYYTQGQIKELKDKNTHDIEQKCKISEDPRIIAERKRKEEEVRKKKELEEKKRQEERLRWERMSVSERENETVKKEILMTLRYDLGLTISELQRVNCELALYSHIRIESILRQLILEGKVGKWKDLQEIKYVLL